MKRPFLWALSSILILLLLNGLFFQIYRDGIFADDYVVIKSKFDRASDKNLPDYLFLGDSPSLSGFGAVHFPKPIFNFSLSCPSNFELYQLLKKINPDKATTKKIFLSLHALSMTDQEHCFEHLILNYNIISFAEFLDALKAPGFLNYASYESKASFLFNLLLLKAFLHPSQYALIHPAALEKNSRAADAIRKVIEEQKGTMSETSLEEFPFEKPPGVFQAKLQMHSFQLYYLVKILEYLQEKKIPVTFYHPLYFEGYKDQLSEAFLASVHALFHDLEKRFSVFTYKPDMIFETKKYFNDAVHPAPEGARLYADWLIQQEGFHVKR